MKLLRRLGLLLAIGLLVTSFAISANINVQNPTGRRYSNQHPLRTGDGTAQEIGADGERVLASELGIPNNNQAGQLQCACNEFRYAQAPPNNCNACFGYSTNIDNFRIPDFVAEDYLAESKNVRELLAVQGNGETTRDYLQIRDLADVAIILELPLWVYVRVDSDVDSAYADIVNPTGGGIVYYFAYEGYKHPANQLAQTIGIVAIFSIALLGAWELTGRKSQESPASPHPLPKPIPPKDPLSKSTSAVNNARELQAKLRQKIDIDLTHHDD